MERPTSCVFLGELEKLKVVAKKGLLEGDQFLRFLLLLLRLFLIGQRTNGVAGHDIDEYLDCADHRNLLDIFANQRMNLEALAEAVEVSQLENLKEFQAKTFIGRTFS